MLRPARPADRAALAALVLAEDAAWSGAVAVGADEAGELVDGFTGGVVLERDGQVVGYAAADAAGATLLLVDPHHNDPLALGELVGWLTAHGGDEISAYARDGDRIAWLRAHGYAARRSVFDLQRGSDPPLPSPVWPAGVTVAPFRPAADAEVVHALVYVDAAWADVAGHTSRSLEGWRSSLGLDPRAWVARDGGRPVGWVAARLFDGGRGWVEQLAVARPARGRGLGRALLLHALGALQAAGAVSFALGVQGENAGAIALYRDVGFTVEREWRVHARMPAPAAAASTIAP